MSQLTPEDVRKVADLAQLEFSPEALPELAEQLRGILDLVECLNEVETSGIEPLAHPIEVANVFREDIPTPMLPREQALANAPRTDGKHFIVPAILDATE